jgi:hypothetical protein
MDHRPERARDILAPQKRRVFHLPAQKSGFASMLCIERTRTQMLWQSTLQSASFIWPVTLWLRQKLPNLHFIMD